MSGRPVRMTRRVAFSSGHRFWIPALSEAENRAAFGSWASPYNHGHNYALEAEVEGKVDPATGMIVNIKRVDDVLQERVVRAFDQKSINDEVPAFHDRAASLENLLLYFAEILGQGALPSEVRLTRLRLEEMPTLWGELTMNDSIPHVTLTRTFEFAAAHRLHLESETPERNWELFGKCTNPAGHGHNYLLEVTVSGSVDPRTGMMVDLLALDRAVEELVVDRYDHKNFNCDVPEFAGVNPTSEVIVTKIFEALDGRLPARLERVRLYETARNIFEISAP